MSKFRLFEKEINIRDYHCLKNNSNEKHQADPYVNIYVRLQNECNAKCKFCEFTSKEKYFNVVRFTTGFRQISEKINIKKVSFTGGEPTLDPPLLNGCLKFVKDVDSNIFTVVNTNGLNLSRIEIDNLDSIALSRHHYDDNINNKILGFRSISTNELSNFR